jgi:alkylation response protein AidB-like acyl-CoA dehydrogenase
VVAWPKEYGGPGWDATQRHIWDEECARIGAPGVLPFGVSMVAPVLMKYGSEAQKAPLSPAYSRWHRLVVPGLFGTRFGF